MSEIQLKIQETEELINNLKNRRSVMLATLLDLATLFASFNSDPKEFNNGLEKIKMEIDTSYNKEMNKLKSTYYELMHYDNNQA